MNQVSTKGKCCCEQPGLCLLLLCTGKAQWSGGTVSSFVVLGDLPSPPWLGLGWSAKGNRAFGMELPPNHTAQLLRQGAPATSTSLQDLGTVEPSFHLVLCPVEP